MTDIGKFYFTQKQNGTIVTMGTMTFWIWSSEKWQFGFNNWNPVLKEVPLRRYPAASTMQKINSVGCFSILVTEGLFIHIYFLLFEENHENRIYRAGEKISPTILLFFRKNDCLSIKV